MATPPVTCIAPDAVFDAYGWCSSGQLEWRCPDAGWDDATPIDGSDPARMVFVIRAGAGEYLPRELARLHARGLGLGDEEALAPWAIDDATDELFARHACPDQVLWLAADNLNALFWGLHDWAHFHNHGPFEQRAWTELQCDAAALAWLWINREPIPLAQASWERVRCEVTGVNRKRFEAEATAFDAAWLEANRVQGLVGDEARRTRS